MQNGIVTTASRHDRPALAWLRLVALLAVLAWVPSASAETSMEGWRNAIRETRLLAENDAPAAYRQALHLQDTLPAQATPIDRASMLNLLARAEVYLAQSDAAEKHAKAALALARQSADRIGQAEAYLNIATNAVNQAQIDEVISSATNSLTVLEGVDRPDLLGESFLRTAMMYRRIGQFDDSVAMCIQAMEIAKNNNNPWALTYAHHGLAISFDQSGRNMEAYEHYMQMRKQARNAHSKILEAYALTGMGRTAASLGNAKLGEANIRESIRLFREVGTPTGVALGLFALSEQQAERGLYAESLPTLQEVIGIYEQYPHKIGLWYTLNAVSSRYLKLGDIAAAQRYAEQAYALAKTIGLAPYQSESAQRMASISAARGDYRQAYHYSMEAVERKAQADRERSSNRIIQLARRYEAESKQRQIDELTRRNEKQAAELQQRALRQRWLWTVLGGSMLMLAGIALFLLHLRRVNVKLRDSQREIQELNIGLEQRIQNRTAELRQQTRYMRTLIDMLPMMAWFKDTQSRFLVVNQAVADAAAEPIEGMIGKADQDFWPEEWARAYRADDVEVMESRNRKTVEEQIIAAGVATWVETYKAPVLDEDGTVLGTVGVARDISQYKATEQAREAALAEAERLARMRSQFLAQMSHELRTPLNGILGYAQILQRSKTLDEQQLDGVRVIQQSGEHLLMLINDILEFAKIDAGKMELTPGDVALDRFLQTITGMIRVRAEEKRVQFLLDLAPVLPAWVHVDERRLRQVLLNLLANAVKFTDAGEVRLCVRQAAPDRLQFEVHDTGIGIAADQQERIFQPFEQTGDLQRRAAGTGLGLAISRQLVRLMGGDICVESLPGQGSVFSFELDAPTAQGWMAPTPQASTGRVVGYAGSRRRVLVVDDIAENRAVVVDMLAPLGFELEQAAHGAEALEKAQLNPPDLILMDLAMSGMGGLEATQHLRQLPGFNEIPIIAISASASGNDEKSSLAAGMNAFLPKPVELERLLAQVAQLLSIEWRYEPLESGPTMAFGPLEVPPEEEMEILYRMALHGNMRDIQQMANRLAGMDERYREFAERLHMLAKGYQSKAILEFVERSMGRSAAP